MLEVITHVVSAERQHGKRVAADGSGFEVQSGCRNFGTDNGSHKNTVIPAHCFVNKRNSRRTASSEQECGNRNSVRIFPFVGNRRAVGSFCSEAGIRMSRFFCGSFCPDITFPVDQFFARFGFHTFPPDITVFGQSHVGENGVFFDGVHGVRVRAHGCSGGNAEESGFGVDGVETSVFAELHPGNIISDGFDFPAGDGRNQHGQVCFSAGGGERTCYVFDFAFRVGQFQDEHVLGQPAFVAGLNGSDTQSQTFFTQQRVSAVTGTVRPDFAGFGEVGNVFLFNWSAGPDAVVAFTGSQRFADGVDTRNEFSVLAQDFQNTCSDTGHGVHVNNNVGGVGQLDADFGNSRTERSHRVRDNIHDASVHTSFVQPHHGFLQFFRIDPVVCGTGIFLFFGSNIGSGFDTGNVGNVGTEQQTVRSFGCAQSGGQTAFDHFIGQTAVFGSCAVTPVNAFRFANGCPFVNPGEQFFVVC